MGTVDTISSALVTIRKSISAFIRSLPSWVRYPLSLLAFWPTALFWRFYCVLFPQRLKWWHSITDTVILGAVPFTVTEIHALNGLGVRGVVNLCREWNWHRDLYPQLSMKQCYLPTIDYDAPTLQHLLKGSRFIADAESRNERVYVHCKAGRGRSTCVVLAYLILEKNMTAREAQAFVQAKRSHISKKWHLPVMREVERIAESRRKGELTSYCADSLSSPLRGNADDNSSASFQSVSEEGGTLFHAPGPESDADTLLASVAAADTPSRRSVDVAVQGVGKIGRQASPRQSSRRRPSAPGIEA